MQLAGGFADSMSRAAQLIADNLSVDFIDLNLGCPIEAVNVKGGGCALFNRSSRLQQVLRAMQMVTRDVPLTVKMRYGLKDGERSAHHVMKRLCADSCPPDLITMHPRSK